MRAALRKGRFPSMELIRTEVPAEVWKNSTVLADKA